MGVENQVGVSIPGKECEASSRGSVLELDDLMDGEIWRE